MSVIPFRLVFFPPHLSRLPEGTFHAAGSLAVISYSIFLNPAGNSAASSGGGRKGGGEEEEREQGGCEVNER